MPIPVDVSVTNANTTCANTLTGALIITPCDTTCIANPTITNINPNQGL